MFPWLLMVTVGEGGGHIRVLWLCSCFLTLLHVHVSLNGVDSTFLLPPPAPPNVTLLILQVPLDFVVKPNEFGFLNCRV